MPELKLAPRFINPRVDEATVNQPPTRHSPSLDDLVNDVAAGCVLNPRPAFVLCTARPAHCAHLRLETTPNLNPRPGHTGFRREASRSHLPKVSLSASTGFGKKQG